MGGQDSSKRAAAAAALADFVQDEMAIALGSGSTAEIFVRLLGEKVRQGALSGIQTAASSHKTEALAKEVGLSVQPAEDFSSFALMLDGADEIDGALRAIKGGGGCHLREKALAQMAEQLILLVDARKLVKTLGKFPLPLEVIPFAHQATAEKVQQCLQHLGYDSAKTAWRTEPDGTFTRTDNQNFLLDCALTQIDAPEALAQSLKQITGVVEHGLFLEEANFVIIGKPDGTTATKSRP